MFAQIRPAIVMIVLFTLLTGVAYPLAVTGIAQVAMSASANGSLVTQRGKVIGSSLIGQNFTSDKYFHGRPSATSAADPADASKTVDAPYNGANSSGSNLGPTSQKLLDRVKADVEARRAGGGGVAIPADAVTTSASGLDPHISPAFALMQASAIAAARNLPLARVQALIVSQTEGRLLGLYGELRVNVLALNLALDALIP